MTSPHWQRRAFTLIELLVVIAIIAVLMGLAFPVFQNVQNSAKKTQAKNDLVQLATAGNAFYTEYGKYPLPASHSGPEFTCGENGQSCGPLIAALLGTDEVLNPRKIEFIRLPDAKDQNNPRSGIRRSDGQFYDPWGRAYHIAIDADYDDEVTNPFGGTPSKLRQGVIAWSEGRNPQNERDRILSWQ